MDKDIQVVRRPLYRQVMSGIRTLVREKRPNDLVGTEAEFAKRFGVSLVTVRQALQRLENEGVIKRYHGRGTFVPEVPTASRHVALLLDADPAHPRLSPYFPKLIQEIRLALKAQGMASRTYFGFGMPDNGLGHGRLSCTDVLDDVRLGRLSGVISFLAGADASWPEVMRAHEVPVLDQEFCWKHGWFSKRAFLLAALAHFQGRKKSRLAVLASENPRIPIQARFSEELRALAPQYGIRLDDRLVDLTASAWETGMGWERFRDLWRGEEKPDSLIVLNDMLFADCQQAIRELRIPVPSALDVLVNSSDAMDLRPQFPVHVYRISTQASAEWYADLMGALLSGAELPSPNLPETIGLTPEGPEDTLQEEALSPSRVYSQIPTQNTKP